MDVCVSVGVCMWHSESVIQYFVASYLECLISSNYTIIFLHRQSLQ